MATLVTGTPGSGKSTLTQYAESINDTRFLDADDVDGLCEWRVFETGEVMGLVSEFIETGMDEWYRIFGWYWRVEVLKSIIAAYPEIVLCGSSENVVEHYALFDQIFIIKKTDNELMSNLSSPDRNNPFGQTPDQRKNFINWQQYLIDEATNFNPIIITGNDIKATYDTITAKVAKFSQ